MSSKLNRSAYEQMVREDLAWLDGLPDVQDSFERHHIRHIVADSVECYYPPPGLEDRIRQRIATLQQIYDGGQTSLSEDGQLRNTLQELRVLLTPGA
jgi:hypothetical protein